MWSVTRAWLILTGNLLRKDVRVEHMAMANTVLEAVSYESQAGPCRSGGNETTSLADSRIFLMICKGYGEVNRRSCGRFWIDTSTDPGPWIPFWSSLLRVDWKTADKTATPAT